MNSVLAFKLDYIKLGQNDSTLGGSYSSTAPLISMILKTSITIASLIFLGLLIFGGITFIMNAGTGDSKKAGQAQAATTNALIGFAVVLLAYSIIRIVEAITGLSILDSNL
jgi:TRAP-type C4-dicarboxylate transport system permease small subunit